MGKPTRTIGFRVYVDESGDEGFVFREDGTGSSRWFVLSAVIVRENVELDTVKLLGLVRADLGRTHRRPLHFRNLKHEQRLPYVGRIARATLKTVNILIHKPSIREPEKFTTKYVLYRYAARYLLERVSWYCRDHRRTPYESARITFSNRASMSYDALRSYLDLLKVQTAVFDVRIDWSVIQSEDVKANQHHKVMGLQIADAVASGMWYAVERSRHGFIEPRYARMLLPTVYAHRGRRLGYGLKLWPRTVAELLRDFPELEWIQQGCK